MSSADVPDDSVPVDPELADLLPDDLTGPVLTGPGVPGAKKGAVPMRRTAKQQAAYEKRKAEAELAAAAAAQANAQRLAQIVNLHISGFSLADIGAQIGASEAEVDRMLTADAARYVRNQPSLRIYVRNWISERYTKMIEADFDIATDENHREKLDHQDRVIKLLDRMAKLHGAMAPVQTEVKVDAAPEAVERLVGALSAAQGLGYDASVFDVVDGEVVEDAVSQSHAALEVSGNRVGDSDGHDDF